jgi:protein-tyrosine phosphatase
MQKHAVKRGYNLTSIARQFNPEYDFDHFDLIIAMDDENVAALQSLARNRP